MSETGQTTDFLLRCNEVLDGFRSEEASLSLQDLVNLLHVKFRSEMSGVLQIDSKGIPRVAYAHPQLNPYVFKETNLEKWLAEDERKVQISKEIQELGNSTRKFAAFRGLLIHKPSIAADPETTYSYHPFFVIFKIPRIYPVFERARSCYVAFIYSDVECYFQSSQLDLQFNHLSSLIDTWAWGITHHRSKLWDCFHELDGAPSISDPNTNSWSNLVSSAKYLGSLLTITEIVKIVKLGYRFGQDTIHDLPDDLHISLGSRLEIWKSQSPLNWHLSIESETRQDLVMTLINWSRWLNRTHQIANQVREYRKSLPAPILEHLLDKPSGRQERWNASYHGSAEGIVHLQRLAMESVEERGLD